jgi:hypothetical protein
MNAFSLALAITVAAAAAAAQNPTGQLLNINNEAWLVIATTKHTTSQFSYLWPPNVPINVAGGSFSPAILGGSATPVVAGTLLWRVIHRELDNRQEARQFKGSRCGLAVSAATTAPVGPFYYPEVTIRKTVPRAGGGLNPDFVSAPLLTTPQGTALLTAAGGHYITTSAIATAIPFTGNDYCITAKYQGGENDDIPNTEGFFGDYSAGAYTGPVTYGHAAPAPAYTLSFGTSDFSSLFLGPLEDKTTVAMHGDYAYRRTVLSPSLYGTNSNRTLSDCALQPTNIGWDVDSGAANGGGFALFLMNIAPAVFPGSFSILGVTVELNIADPALGVLGQVGYVGNLNPQGDFKGTVIPFPALPFLAGQYVTVEGFVIDPTLTNVVDSTGTTSFKI